MTFTANDGDQHRRRSPSRSPSPPSTMFRDRRRGAQRERGRVHHHPAAGHRRRRRGPDVLGGDVPSRRHALPGRPDAPVQLAQLQRQRVVCVVASDGHTTSAPATFTVVVAPVNDPPLARDDIGIVTSGQPLRLSVLANDFEFDGEAMSLDSVSTPLHGTVVIDGDDLVYTTTPGNIASDTFTYTVSEPPVSPRRGRSTSASASSRAACRFASSPTRSTWAPAA